MYSIVVVKVDQLNANITKICQAMLRGLNKGGFLKSQILRNKNEICSIISNLKIAIRSSYINIVCFFAIATAFISSTLRKGDNYCFW